MRLITHHVTSNGGRRVNEDALGEIFAGNFSILAVADGLSGHGGGASAAHQCVDTITTAFARAPALTDDALQSLVDEADRAVAALRSGQGEPAGSMRTTIALLAVCDDQARWAHVGDTRVYWFRDKVLMRRTRDHSVYQLVQGLSDTSLAAPAAEDDRNRLLRIVGAGKGCRAEISGAPITLQASDAFLLCSDGVWGVVDDEAITQSLCAATTPCAWCTNLQKRIEHNLLSKTSKEQDNYSFIVVMFML